MYNLIDYNSSYSETTGRLRFYSRDEITDFNVDIANDNKFKSFKYKEKSIKKHWAKGANGVSRNVSIVVPLKYLINFWRTLEMLLINGKVELKLKWTKYCVLSATGADNNDANSNNIILTIKDTKL